MREKILATINRVYTWLRSRFFVLRFSFSLWQNRGRQLFLNHTSGIRIILGSFIFVLACGLGAFLKSEATWVITIGHEDYLLSHTQELYRLSELQAQALSKGSTLPLQEPKSYPHCSLNDDSGGINGNNL